MLPSFCTAARHFSHFGYTDSKVLRLAVDPARSAPSSMCAIAACTLFHRKALRHTCKLESSFPSTARGSSYKPAVGFFPSIVLLINDSSKNPSTYISGNYQSPRYNNKHNGQDQGPRRQGHRQGRFKQHRQLWRRAEGRLP